MTQKAEINLTFEEALKELESIVRKLEGGGQDLDTSIKDYERGAELRAYCEKKLEEAKMKVETILKQKDGGVKTKPFDEGQS